MEIFISRFVVYINFWVSIVPASKSKLLERNHDLALFPFVLLYIAFDHAFYLIWINKWRTLISVFHSIYSWPYHLTVTRELANFCWRHYDMEELSYEYQWVVHHWSQTIFWYKLIPFFTTLTNAWKHGKEVMLSSSHKLCISSLAHSLKAKFHRNAAERLWFCHANTLKACFPLLF